MRPALPGALRAPPWLGAGALLFWGIAIEQPLAGVALAALRAAADGQRIRFQLDERQLTRAVDATLLALLALLAGFLASAGLPRGLLAATGWLPAALLPLALIGDSNASPLRLRHLALTLRHSALPEAQAPLALGAIHLALTLLAAGIVARPSSAFLAGLALLMTAWLWTLQAGGIRRRLSLAASAIAAAGLAMLLSQGLHTAHLKLQDWVVNTLAAAEETDPYRKETRIGDLGRMKLSENIVWRVEQAPPPAVPLLLRLGVYTQFTGDTWLAQRDAFVAAAASAATGDESAAGSLRLRGASRDGRSLIPVPPGELRILAAGRVERNPLGIVRIADAPAHIEALIQPAAVAAAPILPTTADLALPGRHATLLDRLPELAALKSRPAAERVTALGTWFATHFRYTLFLGDAGTGARDVERFLLQERAGHCEYFATASVLLLRALGVPARYVSGFSVQEYSTLERAFLLRQRHAHAWAEAWVDGRWIEIDNTPGDWLAAEADAAPFWRPLADFASFAWHRFGEWRRQADLRLPLGIALLLLLVCAGFMLRHARRPAPQENVAAMGEPSMIRREFRAMEREFAAHGLARGSAETPRRWLLRLARDGGSVIEAARLRQAEIVVEKFYGESYGPACLLEQRPDPDQQQDQQPAP